MRAIGVGRVVVSKDPSLKLADLVTGLTGVQDYAVVSAKNLNQVDPGLVPLPLWSARIRSVAKQPPSPGDIRGAIHREPASMRRVGDQTEIITVRERQYDIIGLSCGDLGWMFDLESCRLDRSEEFKRTDDRAVSKDCLFVELT